METLIQFIPMIVILIVFYLVMMLPERKRRKKYDEMLNSLFNIDEGLLKMIKIYRISKLDKIKVIVIPVIYMEIKKIMSSTISLIFKVVISSEVYAQPQYGIGSIIQFEKLQLNTSAIIGWMIIITLIICFIDFITTKLIRGERENANK